MLRSRVQLLPRLPQLFRGTLGVHSHVACATRVPSWTAVPWAAVGDVLSGSRRELATKKAKAKKAGKAGKAGGNKYSGGGSSAAASVDPRGRGVDGEFVFGMQGVGKVLPGGRVLFSDVSLSFQRGAKIGVLGLNGAGKSSVLKILAGVDTEFDGDLWRESGLRIGYLAQEPELDASKDVHGNIMDGLKEKTTLLDRMDELGVAMADPDADMDALMEEMAEVQGKIEVLDCWNLKHTIDIAKNRVPPDDADVTTLSGGERRRVALCRLLLEEPDVLLLDEPTNHLDPEAIHWMENFLQEYKGTVIAVTHDRYFLDNVAGWILEIDRGRAYPYAGNYSVWLDTKAQRLAMEAKADKRRQRAMQEELQWIRQGAKAQQSKSKARLKAYDKMVKDADQIQQSQKFVSGAVSIPPGPRLGDVVLEFDKVTMEVDGRTLFKDVSFSLPKGAIVGVVGPNGAGKSTMLRLIAGDVPPTAGAITLGDTVELGFVSQSRDGMHPDQSALDAISGGMDTVVVGDREVNVRQYMAGFNLVGPVQTKRVGSMSGGERARVHLAKTLRHACNLLLLDEPSNDLDVDTMRSLEEAFETFTGCAVVVSHDRYFLDRLCTHCLVFKPGGSVEFFPGNFSEWEAFTPPPST